MSEAREKFYMEMNDEFNIADKITVGRYTDELEKKIEDMINDLEFIAEQEDSQYIHDILKKYKSEES